MQKLNAASTYVCDVFILYSRTSRCSCAAQQYHHIENRDRLYSRTFETTPAPTVLPPSLSAKRRPSAMGTGYINSIVSVALSPGTTYRQLFCIKTLNNVCSNVDVEELLRTAAYHFDFLRKSACARYVRSTKEKLRPEKL